MILVFSSSLYEHDPQNDLLLEYLVKSGKNHSFINPLDLEDISRLELSLDTAGPHLLLDGLEIFPRSIYLARNFRFDCFLNIPSGCTYPVLFRQKVETFFDEICQTLGDREWFPAKPSLIKFAEAKIALLAAAKSCHLFVPTYTKNSFLDLSGEINYRKVLGHPFTITLDKEEKEEVAITLINSVAAKEDDLLCIPWQWQDYVKFTAQIRCVVTGDKIHSYSLSADQLRGRSLREAQEDGLDLIWLKHELPGHIQTSLKLLMSKLSLRLSCPEFLITEDGEYVFIDMNPCGDWFGFLNESENHLIAHEIVKML
jgi:hypothetical protein